MSNHAWLVRVGFIHCAGRAKGNAYGANVDKWKETPTISNCTTCHDLTTFDLSTTVSLTSAGTATSMTAIKHTGSSSAQTDATCINCHGSESDNTYSGALSPEAVHTLPISSSLNDKLVFNITQVEGAISGSTATVHFTVKDNTGADYVLTGGTPTTGVAAVGDTVTIVLSYVNGPDYENTAPTFIASDFVQGRTKAVSAPSKATTVGTDPSVFKVGNEYVVSFNTVTVPNVAGVGTFAIIASHGITLPDVSSTGHRKATSTSAKNGLITVVPATLAYYNFDLQTGTQLTDATKIRRVVVTTDKCNACHTSVFGHGGRSEITLCVMCHAPNLFNKNQQGYSGNLKDLIHGIHGAQVSAQGTLFNGHPNSPVMYPNDPKNCTACHVSDPMAALPLPAGVNGSLKTGATSVTLTGTRVPPTKAACVACHESASANAHADLMTVGTGTNAVESCDVCHASGNLLGNVHSPSI